MRQYVIRSSKPATMGDALLLTRAFARKAGAWSHAVGAVRVAFDSAGFRISMEMTGEPSDCEDLFALAWYDAFGDRGTTHAGWLLDDGGALRPGAVK